MSNNIEIHDAKSTGKDELSRIFLEKNISNTNIVNILEKLGRLPNDFDGKFLIDLLENPNSQVRYWVVKTLGKLSDAEYLSILQNVAESDNDTSVRREATSSIGRMRSPNAKKILLKILQDHDPKIVCQAIRGLLFFKGDVEVDGPLQELINHQNEIVRTVIYKEYFAKRNAKIGQPHSESHDYLKNVVVNADTIEVMKNLPDESIHLTFTSPPYYNARDYSIYPSYDHYLNFLSEVFKQVYRITKEGRFLILNTSPIIIQRVSRQHSSKRYPIPFDIHPYLVKMGWEFIDDIIWMKPEASVKNRIGGFQQHRKPLAYKPNNITEYLMVYRKSTEKLLDWNIRQYGQGIVQESKVEDGFETTNVWKIDPCFDKVHSAVFPVELCKRVIKYYSFKGDLVFDPFGGSGTVGKTAKLLERYFFLTEKDELYFQYMKSMKSNGVFDEYPTKFMLFSQFNKEVESAVERGRKEKHN